MISDHVTAILLVIPILTMIIPSINYWSEYKKTNDQEKQCKKAHYNSLFYLFVVGVFGMWVVWIGSIILLFLSKYHSTFKLLEFTASHEVTIQIIGFVIFYIGALTYNLNIIVAGKYLRPAPSGILENHRLVIKGPFAIIRHPLYVSYILIATGLSFILLSYWLLIPTLFLIVGIYPTANAEEKVLMEQFGAAYSKYQIDVGMFFPKRRKEKSIP